MGHYLHPGGVVVPLTNLDAGGHSVFVPCFPRLPLHSRRFGRPSRWEAQITQMYGEVAGDNVMDFDYGWMAMAQDRCSWRDAAKAFAQQFG